MFRNYQAATKQGVGFRLAFIPAEFSVPKTGEFDKAYMNALFDFAIARARTGYPWLTDVEGLVAVGGGTPAGEYAREVIRAHSRTVRSLPREPGTPEVRGRLAAAPVLEWSHLPAPRPGRG